MLKSLISVLKKDVQIMMISSSTRSHLSMNVSQRSMGTIAGFQYKRDHYAERPPKLFVEQDDRVTSTHKPPYYIQRIWKGIVIKRKKFLGIPTHFPVDVLTLPEFVHPGSSPMTGVTKETWENAMVLVDKPKDITSSKICRKLIDKLGGYPSKAGHAGTLDPMATGLLILCMGRATKIVSKFVSLDKEYTGMMRLGEITRSYDSTGEIVEKKQWSHITNDDLREASESFVGDQEQVPPMYSAKKIDGVRLYKLARKNIEVKRNKVPINIRFFNVKREDETSQDVYFNVRCSKGTYIRSLVHDMGMKLGCGAHMIELRRTAIGSYHVDNAWNFEKLLACIRDSRIASE